MDFGGILDLAKDYAASYTKHIGSFFSSSTKQDTIESTDVPRDIYSMAAISLVIGVTLQDRFISNVDTSKINWLDRAMIQVGFWIFLALIATAVLSAFDTKNPSRAAFQTVFGVLPVAFVCGAYAAALSYFGKFVFGVFSPVWWDLVPSVIFVFVQVFAVLKFCPREIRRAGVIDSGPVRTTTSALLLVVLAIDLLVIFNHYLECALCR